MAIVGLDVHQGNRTNTIFADDESVYMFSMHGRPTYPFAKSPGSFDVELEDAPPTTNTSWLWTRHPRTAGGYGRDLETTVAIHAEAARLAAEFAAAGSANV